MTEPEIVLLEARPHGAPCTLLGNEADISRRRSRVVSAGDIFAEFRGPRRTMGREPRAARLHPDQ